VIGGKIIHGDCLDVLRTLPAASVDSVVTDPPYGLAFMGKRWDYDVPSVEVWAECLRVLKPGGHLLAFAGTRTQHRMAVKIEDAGFEIRDMIAWVYGSGFPKSLDVSKAIDKTAGSSGERGPMKRGGERLARLADGRRNGDGRWGDESGRDPFTYIATTAAARQWSGWGTALKPALEPITVARKPLVGTVAENVLAHGTGAINVHGCRISALTGQRPDATSTAWAPEKNLCDSCAGLAESPAKPGTPATRGSSAGSPAVPTTSGKGEIARADTGKADTGCSVGLFPEEPATDRTADSSLSTGALGRMHTGQSRQATKSTTSTATDSTTDLRICAACGCSITDQGISGSTLASQTATPSTPAGQGSGAAGRWPSNFIHDGSDEVVGLFPNVKAGVAVRHRSGGKNCHSDTDKPPMDDMGYGDSGSAARFFYCAKANKRDRGDGNNHPTVKPTDLMRYLCRLVTPPGGTVLDPFMGSGSTGKAALLEGFRLIGIEREAEYVEIARARIAAIDPLFGVAV